jgi:hypothetical protein
VFSGCFEGFDGSDYFGSGRFASSFTAGAFGLLWFK